MPYLIIQNLCYGALAIKIIVLSSLFERDISSIVLEINQNLALQKHLEIDSKINEKREGSLSSLVSMCHFITLVENTVMQIL